MNHQAASDKLYQIGFSASEIEYLKRLGRATPLADMPTCLKLIAALSVFVGRSLPGSWPIRVHCQCTYTDCEAAPAQKMLLEVFAEDSTEKR